MIPDDGSWPKHVGRWLGIGVSLLVHFSGILFYMCVWLHSFKLFLFLAQFPKVYFYSCLITFTLNRSDSL
jgi:hypothetical protein